MKGNCELSMKKSSSGIPIAALMHGKCSCTLGEDERLDRGENSDEHDQ